MVVTVGASDAELLVLILSVQIYTAVISAFVLEHPCLF